VYSGNNDHRVYSFSAKDGTNPLFDFKDGVVQALKEAEGRRLHESQESRKRIEVLG